LVLGGILATSAQAGAFLAALEKGTPDLRSAGALAFGPEGILLIGDAQGAAIFAVDTNDRSPGSSGSAINVEAVNEKIAAMLGTTSKQIMINDLAVNPVSGKAYLSVSRGQGPGAMPVILRVNGTGKLEEFSLKDVNFSKAELPDPPSAGPAAKGQGGRAEAITDLAYTDGRVFVAGLSNEEFSSRLISMPFPFTKSAEGASIEIFHGSHGRLETKSPIRTFVTYQIDGEPYILASYTCTPLVKIPVSSLKAGSHVKGTTIAELGNRNKPLDMVVYKKGGKDYLLLANSSRGLMKIPTTGADKAKGIVKQVADKQGMPYETVAAYEGVVQLDMLDGEHALVLVQKKSGAQNLETIDLP
jgi:hypothetical protein